MADLKCTVVIRGEENWFVPWAQDLVQELGHIEFGFTVRMLKSALAKDRTQT